MTRIPESRHPSFGQPTGRKVDPSREMVSTSEEVEMVGENAVEQAATFAMTRRQQNLPSCTRTYPPKLAKKTGVAATRVFGSSFAEVGKALRKR